MTADLITTLTERAKVALDPVRKLNVLAVSNLEKLTALQMDSLKDYSERTIRQLKAATEVDDLDSLRKFLNGQGEAFKDLGEKLSADARAVVELSTDFNGEVKKIAEEAFASAKGELGAIQKEEAA